MADIGSFFTATLARQIMPSVNDQILARNDLLRYLKEKGCIHYNKGGDGFQMRHRSSASAIGGATGDWGTRNFQTTQPFTATTLPYRQYSWPLAVSLFQMQRNENAGVEAKMFEMAAEQLNEVRQSATARIAQHAYTGHANLLAGDTATPIDGLVDWSSVGNTYAGVNQALAANAWWRAQVDACTQFTLDSLGIGITDGINTMERVFLACARGKQSGDSIPQDVAVEKDLPDLILTTSAMHRGYFMSLFPQFRYTEASADSDKDLTFHGIKVTWDEICPALTMFFLNSRHLFFDVVGKQLLTVLLERDEPNPPLHIWLLGGQFQFYCRSPRHQGIMTATSI